MNNPPTSQKSYMIKAIREWIIDNGGKPVIFIDLSILLYMNGAVPVKFFSDDNLVLNISDKAAKNLLIDINSIKFDCTFDDIEFNCDIPVSSITGMVDIDTKQGLVFDTSDTSSSKKLVDGIISNIQSKFL